MLKQFVNFETVIRIFFENLENKIFGLIGDENIVREHDVLFNLCQTIVLTILISSCSLLI
jgi:hypothetical protein